MFFDEWLKAIEEGFCHGLCGADHDDAKEVVGRYRDKLHEFRLRLDHGETDLWMLVVHTDAGVQVNGGELNYVMGWYLHRVPGPPIRLTLVSLAAAAERVRQLTETGQIEVADLPPARTTGRVN